MREFTVRISFLSASLGNDKGKDGVFRMPRAEDGKILFSPAWWSSTIRYAARVGNRHQRLVNRIRWDPLIDCAPRTGRLFRRYFPDRPGRFAEHEAFFPDETIGVNCVVPDSITQEDLFALLTLSGRYQGISPFKPRKHGLFQVVSVRQRYDEANGSDNVTT